MLLLEVLLVIELGGNDGRDLGRVPEGRGDGCGADARVAVTRRSMGMGMPGMRKEGTMPWESVGE
jgi:hypothetical protein